MSRAMEQEEQATNRVLVVEDHDASRHLLERNLKFWGYDVVSAADGESAVAALAGEDPPAIALIDWLMPGMSGIEVCRKVREFTPPRYSYLILLTALGSRKDITSGLEAGADDYVVKPFEPDELRARLKVGRRIVALERRLSARVEELTGALADVKRLKGLLPICMYCKRIRDDQDYWRQIEEYIHTETGADFSHGICPTCLAALQSSGGLGC